MIRFVEKSDIISVLEMMEEVKDDFAGYKEKEFVDALHLAIRNKEAFVDARDNKIAGMLSFSRTEKELSFLAVLPDYRKEGIAKQLISHMESCFSVGETIHVVTFQEGDRKGIAARSCYHACGFIDDEKFMVYDYPCQKLIKKL